MPRDLCYTARVIRWAPVLFFVCLTGCSSCGEAAELSVSGAHPYTRCHLAEPPEERVSAVGDLTLRFEDERVLRIEGAPSSLRLAVFAGPVGASVPEAPEADLAIALGGLGDEPLTTLSALGEWGIPVLVVAGGEERFEPLSDAFEALEGDARQRVIDATVLRLIRVGKLELVVVPGAPEGRYVTAGEGACGFGEPDLAHWEMDAPDEGVRRYLLAWAGPAGTDATRGLLGAEAGSPLVARLMTSVGAEGALFAWPRSATGRAAGEGMALTLGVAPIAGVTVLRADGSRAAPGVTRLTLRPEAPSLTLESP
ncbi:MAG: hypothetical protein RLO52_14030 [Sandaracinaceae bacterium]